jgi:uncharacterized protein
VKRLLFWTLDHPFLSVGLLALLTVVLGAQIPKIRVDESAEGLMVQNDPARKFYEQAKQRFGGDNLTIVVVKAADVFTVEVLGIVRWLSDNLGRTDGVSRVESLTTVKNIRGRGDLLDTESLVGDPIPTDSATLTRIRGDALGNRALVGNLVAGDGRTTAIVVYADPTATDVHFNRRFSDHVDALIRQQSRSDVTLYQVGAPLTKATYSRGLERHMRTSIPLAAGVLLVVLFVCFRMVHGVLIPVVTAVVSIVWALGALAILGIPLTILTGAIPALLLAIGFTEDVHMIAAYHDQLRLGAGKLAAIRNMIDETALAILVTSATTILGFASLVLTDITMLIEFGYASALGLTANFVITMVAVPVLLRWWRAPRRIRTAVLSGQSSEGRIPAWMERLAEFNLRHRVAICGVTGLLVALSLVGWYSLRVDTDLIRFFPRGSVIRTRVDDLQRSLSGGLAFYVVVDAGRDDGIKDPALLRKIAALQDFLMATGKVDKTVSVVDYIRKMHREMNAGDPAFEIVPDSADQVAQYLLLLEGDELAKFIDFNASGANIVVRHHLSGSHDLSALLRQLDGYIARTFPPSVVVRSTGEEILYNDAADYMSVNEITSFSFTFIAIGLIHALLFMSLRVGLLSLIPNVIPIVCTYGFMGLVGIPLNTATAMVASIAVGIAVDDTVHHMMTFSRQLNEHHDQKIAMVNTLKSQGQPIIYVSLALALGFLVTAVSTLIPSVQFGLLAAFVMILAMVAELILTPILMYSVRLITLWDLVLVKMRPEVVRAAPLFAGLSRWEARKVVLLGTLRPLAPGQLAVRKGETGTEMYMLVSGRVRVFDIDADGHERTLVRLEPGAVFGEIALLTRGVRSVNVVAEMESEILRLDFPALERIRLRFPYTGAKLFRNLARMLSDRLRRVTDELIEQGGPALPPVRFEAR